MKMVTVGRQALIPSRRHLPLLKVVLASATLVVAGLSGLTDTPIVATRPFEVATLDPTRAGRLPAAGVANFALSGLQCSGRNGVGLDHASSEGQPAQLVHCSLFTGLFPPCRPRLGHGLSGFEQACAPAGVAVQP